MERRMPPQAGVKKPNMANLRADFDTIFALLFGKWSENYSEN
jgi:hypothetical protein